MYSAGSKSGSPTPNANTSTPVAARARDRAPTSKVGLGAMDSHRPLAISSRADARGRPQWIANCPAELVQFREQLRQLKQRMHAELAYAASVQIQPEDS